MRRANPEQGPGQPTPILAAPRFEELEAALPAGDAEGWNAQTGAGGAFPGSQEEDQRGQVAPSLVEDRSVANLATTAAIPAGAGGPSAMEARADTVGSKL